jgi:uncharacterized membrane protein HdeD (DUF308 family)
MENSVSTFWNSSHHWRLLFVLGILTAICGICFFLQPEIAYTVLSLFFGLSLLIGGFILLMLASVNRIDKPAGWWWVIISGAFGVLAGIFLMVDLGFIESAIPYIFSFVLFVQAVFNIFSSIHMYRRSKIWWAYLLNGILLFIFSLIFFFYPFSSAIVLVTVSAIMMVYWGISMVFLSLDLRRGKN